MCLIPAWAGRKLKIIGRLLCGETPSSFYPTDSPPSAGLLTTSVQRWGDLFRAMFPGLGLLMAKFSLLLFNWVHWAILYSKVMHVSYSLISAPSQLTNIFTGKSFYFSFSFSSISKSWELFVKLGGRSPCRNELLCDRYSRYSWLLSSLQSPSSDVASPGSCLLAITFQLLPCVSSQVLNRALPMWLVSFKEHGIFAISRPSSCSYFFSKRLPKSISIWMRTARWRSSTCLPGSGCSNFKSPVPRITFYSAYLSSPHWQKETPWLEGFPGFLVF